MEPHHAVDADGRIPLDYRAKLRMIFVEPRDIRERRVTEPRGSLTMSFDVGMALCAGAVVDSDQGGVAAAMFVVTACAAERLGPDLLVSMVHRALVTRLALGVGSLPGSAQRLRPSAAARGNEIRVAGGAPCFPGGMNGSQRAVGIVDPPVLPQEILAGPPGRRPHGGQRGQQDLAAVQPVAPLEIVQWDSPRSLFAGFAEGHGLTSI